MDTREKVERNCWTGPEELVYRNKKGEWCMGTGIDSFCHGLYNENKTDSVPLKGWKCWNGDASFDDEEHWWIEDPHLKFLKSEDHQTFRPLIPPSLRRQGVSGPGLGEGHKEFCVIRKEKIL